MKQKWYLKTWVICILFTPTILAIAAPGLFIFPLVGIVLIIMQSRSNKKIAAGLSTYNQLLESIEKLQTEHSIKLNELNKSYSEKENTLKQTYEAEQDQLQKQVSSIRDEVAAAKYELGSLENTILARYYSFSDYDGISSEECKNKLAMLKTEESDLVKSGNALLVTSTGTKKEINDNKKQILRCFNSECDNIIMNLSVKNIDSMRNKIAKSFETLNHIFRVDGISMCNKLLEYKLEELNLAYTYELKKEQERETQKAIKEQMIEEEKVRREIERQKAKIEKDQLQCNNEINKLMSYMQKTSSDIEKQLYIDKIKELEQKLSLLEQDKENVLEREANARAGFVYVISNIGSFGEGIYKIGMTRRLEPMDRIKELSSASVPFNFDVHAMIFSDDAPELETILHKHFEKQSVNRVNLRKEFFRVSLDEIEKVVKENFNNTVQFIRVPDAVEYRQTLEMCKSEEEMSLQ